MTDELKNTINQTVEKITSNSGTRYVGLKETVKTVVEYLQIALFPSYNGQDFYVCKECEKSASCLEKSDSGRRTTALNEASENLVRAMNCFLSPEESCQKTALLIEKIPTILQLLSTDITAAFQGDPAAESEDEIILAYPCFPAITIYRLAHELYLLNVPVIPRMMTEYAHELTGIDIHPGATIGPYFFIDHGTGVVIGETTTIGDHVKIYQHVTLGAKSFDMLPDGSLVKGIKRHPDIGNNVVIYAGATILGGDTRIGNNCTIGGNVWLTHSIRDNQTVIR